MSPKHISAIELQQQLLDIDCRLTDLELRGRDLEDSIRNGKSMLLILNNTVETSTITCQLVIFVSLCCSFAFLCLKKRSK